jgi:hypothetical protein
MRPALPCGGWGRRGEEGSNDKMEVRNETEGRGNKINKTSNGNSWIRKKTLAAEHRGAGEQRGNGRENNYILSRLSRISVSHAN